MDELANADAVAGQLIEQFASQGNDRLTALQTLTSLVRAEAVRKDALIMALAGRAAALVRALAMDHGETPDQILKRMRDATTLTWLDPDNDPPAE